MGLKPETADCYNREEEFGFSNCIGKPSLPTDIPAWSLHRLMIIGNIGKSGFTNVDEAYNTCISLIASHIRFGLLNKEILTEKLLPQGLQDMLSAHRKYTAQANDINNEIMEREYDNRRNQKGTENQLDNRVC